MLRANLHEVSKSPCGAAGRGKDIIDPSKLEDLLGNPCGHNSGTTRSRNHAHRDGAALAGDLTRNSVGLADLVPPVTPPDGDHRELGKYDGATYGRGDLFATLNAETNMAVVVANDDEGLEAGTLTSPGLLLDRHDLHDLVLKARAELVHDLMLLDGQRVEVDLLQRLYLFGLHETPKLRHRHPLLLLFTAWPAPASAATVSPRATTAETSPESTAVTSRTFSHCWDCRNVGARGLGLERARV